MRKFIYILLLAMPMFFESCSIQKEVEIYKPKKTKKESFEHRNATVSDGIFSKNRKMRTRHTYFFKGKNGWVFIPRREHEFIRYTRTRSERGSGGKVRVFRKKQKFAYGK